MEAPSTVAAVMLTILTRLAYLCHRATHHLPFSGIPYKPHSTRRLFGDMPELEGEAQRHRNPVRMLLSYRWFVCVNDTREIQDLLQNRLRKFDKSPAFILPFKPVVPEPSLANVKGPESRTQVRLCRDIICVGFLRDQAAPIQHHAALELIELWRVRARVAGDRMVWIRDDFKIATSDVIRKALLGSDANAIDSEQETVLEWAHAIKQPKFIDEPAEMAVARMREESMGHTS